MMKIGLRIDVDTFRGTELGVPKLCEILADHSIKATFFFSVGPDNMGRHLWRLLKPAFFLKMLRSHAASLYGWDFIFKGTFWPGPLIGKELAPIIKAAADAGHEAGLHTWDHHAWQTHLDEMDSAQIFSCLDMGNRKLKHILSKDVLCSADPGWKSNSVTLKEKTKFPFRFNSDCRGRSIFQPVVDGQELSQPQVPVTLPTYDEVIGRNGVTNGNYNDYLLSLVAPNKLNVLTIHAESEGIACVDMFNAFVKNGKARGISFVSLGTLVSETKLTGRGRIVAGEIPGREGWVACQAEEVGR
jgi:undecaprenyl phosphate-alpha-L-ara4FN deformylase